MSALTIFHEKLAEQEEQTIRFTGKKVDPNDFNKKLYLTCVKRAAKMSNEEIATLIDDRLEEIALMGLDCMDELSREMVAIFGFLLARRPK